MIPCPFCGFETYDDMSFCPRCGKPLTYFENSTDLNPWDIPNKGLNILCFCFPLLGLILYLIWYGTCPVKAESMGKAALFGYLTGNVLACMLLVAFTYYGVSSDFVIPYYRDYLFV